MAIHNIDWLVKYSLTWLVVNENDDRVDEDNWVFFQLKTQKFDLRNCTEIQSGLADKNKMEFPHRNALLNREIGGKNRGASIILCSTSSGILWQVERNKIVPELSFCLNFWWTYGYSVFIRNIFPNSNFGACLHSTRNNKNIAGFFGDPVVFVHSAPPTPKLHISDFWFCRLEFLVCTFMCF